MATYQQLQQDVCNWLNRQDPLSLGLFPGWTAMLETELSETLRARCQVTTGYQDIDALYIALPSNFATMESIRDSTSGNLLELKDEWSGSWTSAYFNTYANTYSNMPQVNPYAPAIAYRLVANCIEFLPHPAIPNPPNPAWIPQQVLMAWYAKPTPLLQATDTNPILEQLYQVYLYGLCRIGALWALDDDRAAQMDAAYQQAVTRANLHKQQSDYSGAPFRAELVTF